MDYNNTRILNWLKEHPAINISKIEELAEIPKSTLRHFVNDRRVLSEQNKSKIVSVLLEYGFTE